MLLLSGLKAGEKSRPGLEVILGQNGVVTIRIHNKNVCAVVKVWVVRAITYQRNRSAIGTPYGIGVIVVTKCKLDSCFDIWRVHINMCAPTIQIAAIVLFKLHPIDNVGNSFIIVTLVFGQVSGLGVG